MNEILVIEDERLNKDEKIINDNFDMNDITSKIYEIRGQEVMLDSEIVVTKCHYYFFDKIVMHYDIGKPISMLINFADTSAKLERS